MRQSSKFQTILGADGRPAFVVVPYDEFVRNFEQNNDLVPNAVVKLAFDDEMTPAKSWRTHLGLTQVEAAQRMGITQGAYAQLEASTKTAQSLSREDCARVGHQSQPAGFLSVHPP